MGGGTYPRYTPYHIPHRTEVMGFMTFLHGDDRFYNNIFVQKWPGDPIITPHDSDDGHDEENRAVGTHVWDEYPTYDEWIAQFDMDTDTPNMMKLARAHDSHLPVWSKGNVYFNGAKAWKHEEGGLVDNEHQVYVNLETKDGRPVLSTNVYDFLEGFTGQMVNTQVLGMAFEPEEYYENPDGTPINFNTDYFGDHRGEAVIPGPFACKCGAEKELF